MCILFYDTYLGVTQKMLKLREAFKADTHEGLCSRSMLQARFARVSTHEEAFSSSLNMPRELAPKYVTG